MKQQITLKRITRTAIFAGLFFIAGLNCVKAQITPHFDCAEPIYTNGVLTQLRAYYGYTNAGSSPVIITDGPNNFFFPNPGGQSGQQTITFQPGYVKRGFSILIAPTTPITWFVQNRPAPSFNDWTGFCGVGAITYQGKLTVSGAAANQPHDFRFGFYDEETGGTERGSPVTLINVPVTNGVFTVQLDILPYIRNGNYVKYMQIGVRRGGSTGEFETLLPRQQLTVAPYALNAANAIYAQKVAPTFPSSNTNPAPLEACATANQGKILFNATANRLWICGNSGWVSVTLQ